MNDSGKKDMEEEHKDNSMIKYLLSKKLTPGVSKILILTCAFLVLVGMNMGYSFDFMQMKFSKLDNDRSITSGELTLMSGKYFKPDMSKAEIMAAIQSLIDKSNDIEIHNLHYAYKLSRVKLAIAKYGGYIDTRIDNESRKSDYKLIQEVMRDISYYDGQIDGDQKRTFKAVKRFQEKYNHKNGKDIFKQKHFWFLGEITLKEIRKAYNLTLKES